MVNPALRPISARETEVSFGSQSMGSYVQKEAHRCLICFYLFLFLHRFLLDATFLTLLCPFCFFCFIFICSCIVRAHPVSRYQQKNRQYKYGSVYREIRHDHVSCSSSVNAQRSCFLYPLILMKTRERDRKMERKRKRERETGFFFSQVLNPDQVSVI